MIDQKWEESAKNISENQDEAQDGNRKDQIHDELAAHVAVDHFHRSALLVPFRECGKWRDPFGMRNATKEGRFPNRPKRHRRRA